MYGKQLEEIRKKTGMSQTEFGKMFDVPQTSISSWERAAYPPLEYIKKICDYINIELWEFFIDKEQLSNYLNISPGIIKLNDALRQLDDPIREEMLNLIHRQIVLYYEVLKSRK